MNDRIRDIALEASIKYIAAEEWIFTDSELEKVAEMIIRECMKLNCQQLSITAIERILPLYEEHFGVDL